MFNTYGASKTKTEESVLFDHMKTYNDTEKVQFALAIQAAQEWQEILKDEDIFPNLEYRAVMDENTRESHAKLNGIVRPIRDPFWQRYYPPIDYRCRCTIRQRRKNIPITENLPHNLPTPPKGLAHNPGFSGKAFDLEHPYFEHTTPKALENVIKYAKYGREYIKEYFNIQTGNYVVRHQKHSTQEAAENVLIAKLLTNHVDSVVLLPVDAEELSKIVPKSQFYENKFPDAWLIDARIAMDFKTISSQNYNTIDNALRRGKSQADYILLKLKTKVKEGHLKNIIKSRVSRAENIKGVWLILEDRLYKLSRQDILEDRFPF